MKCSLSNAYTQTISDNLAEWHGVHAVLPPTHTFIHEWNEPSFVHFVSIHQMASPEQGGAHLDQLTTYLSTSKGWKAELAELADLVADGTSILT